MFSSIILAAIVLLSAISLSATSVMAQDQSSSISSMAGGFASITTTQTDNQIIITITKDTSFTPPSDGGGTGTPETPEGPIIIIPDPGGNGNGTVIIPPISNETITTGEGENVTAPPVIVIDPNGNTTQIEPPSNVTVVNNDTVIIAPPNQTVTETPGNVTVIDPPVTTEEGNITGDCGCPIGVEGPAPDIQFPPSANMTQPIISNNTDITVNQPIVPEDLPSEESGSGDNGGNNNGDGGNGNGDGNGDNNN